MKRLKSLKFHDLVYETPPMEWEYGIPLGNGFIGAMVWGDGNPLHITLDHPGYFDERLFPEKRPWFKYKEIIKLYRQGRIEEMDKIIAGPHRNVKNKPPFKVAAGFLDITLPKGINIKDMRLRLNNAILTIALSQGNQIEITACMDIPVLYMHFQDMLLNESHITIHSGSGEVPDVEKGMIDGVHWEIQPLADGSRGVIAWQLRHEKKDTFLFATVQHDYKEDSLLDKAISVLSSAISRSEKSIHSSQKNWWTGFWKKSDIEIPDGRLESLWYIEMYKLASCSRKGAIPPNLQGLWPPHGQKPPWKGEHANNINTQMTYWPVYTSNHMELLEPFHDWLIEDQLPAAKECAKATFDFDGAKFATASVGRRGEIRPGYTTVYVWPAVGAWWCQHLWWAYLYGQDRDFLRDRSYPFMRECMIFYEQLLEADKNGILHVPLTHSPEWFEDRKRAWCSDSTIDLSLVRYAADAASRAADILGANEDKKRWRHIADNMAPYPRIEHKSSTLYGLQIYPGEDLFESHRHLSHLVPIYPCGDLNIEGSEEDRALIFRSMRNLEARGMGEWVGFSFSWAACIGARLGWGNYARKMLDLYIDGFISPNTFHLNGDYKRQGLSVFHYTPFTYEAGSGAAAAIMEMLLQSWGGIIRIFPAIPQDWRNVAFDNLRAEGAFLVSAKMNNGCVSKVEIQSENGGLCRIKNNFKSPMALLNGKKRQVCTEEIIEFETTPGGVHILMPSAPIDCKKNIVKQPKTVNYFGLKNNTLMPSSPIKT